MINRTIVRLLTSQFKTHSCPCQQENSSCVKHGSRTSICGKLERAFKEISSTGLKKSQMGGRTHTDHGKMSVRSTESPCSSTDCTAPSPSASCRSSNLLPLLTKTSTLFRSGSTIQYSCTPACLGPELRPQIMIG